MSPRDRNTAYVVRTQSSNPTTRCSHFWSGPPQRLPVSDRIDEGRGSRSGRRDAPPQVSLPARLPGLSIFPNFQEKQHCIHESSRTDLDDDVVDATPYSALDVVEIKHCIHVVVTFLSQCFFWKFGQPCLFSPLLPLFLWRRVSPSHFRSRVACDHP